MHFLTGQTPNRIINLKINKYKILRWNKEINNGTLFFILHKTCKGLETPATSILWLPGKVTPATSRKITLGAASAAIEFLIRYFDGKINVNLLEPHGFIF